MAKQLVITKGIRVGEQPHKINTMQSKTAAEAPRDSFYKSMNKKVKSSANNQPNSNHNTQLTNQTIMSSNAPRNYNSTGIQNKQGSVASNSNQVNYIDKNGNQLQINKQMVGSKGFEATQEEGQFIAQSKNPQSNKAVYKSKRITDSTRGIASGTNARVNTFDNRNAQVQQ